MSRNTEDENLMRYFTDFQEKDGIKFFGGNDVESKFSNNAQDDLFEIEDTSWWFQYRARVVEQIANMFLKKDACLFDIGGGNGYTTYHLQEAGYKTVLLEPSPAACHNAKKRGLRSVVCGTLTADTVNDSSIRQAAMLDVLEHIEEDEAFLKTLWSKMDTTPTGGGGVECCLQFRPFRSCGAARTTAPGITGGIG